MSESTGGGSTETAVIARTFLEMAKMAQRAESMLPGFDRQMRVAGDAAAAAQLVEAHKEFKAVQDALDRAWAQIEPTITGVLQAHPQISPPQ
jgi:hypothetical protein